MRLESISDSEYRAYLKEVFYLHTMTDINFMVCMNKVCPKCGHRHGTERAMHERGSMMVMYRCYHESPEVLSPNTGKIIKRGVSCNCNYWREEHDRANEK
jgi:hypothetical protein